MNTSDKSPVRLSAFREVMRRERLDAFIVSSSDTHLDRCVPPYWRGLQWLSGFAGDEGCAVVTQRAAVLWAVGPDVKETSGRHVSDCFCVQPFRQGEVANDVVGWIAGALDDINGAIVGLDGAVTSVTAVARLTLALRRRGGITLRTNFNPLNVIWKDRPVRSAAPVAVDAGSLNGESVASRLSRIRGALARMHCDGLLVTSLVDVAWALGLRSADMSSGGLFYGYLLIAPDKATLYINNVQLSDSVRAYLQAEGVTIADYDRVKQGLYDYFAYNILLDPAETCADMPACVSPWTKVVSGVSPIPALRH